MLRATEEKVVIASTQRTLNTSFYFLSPTNPFVGNYEMKDHLLEKNQTQKYTDCP